MIVANSQVQVVCLMTWEREMERSGSSSIYMNHEKNTSGTLAPGVYSCCICALIKRDNSELVLEITETEHSAHQTRRSRDIDTLAFHPFRGSLKVNIHRWCFIFTHSRRLLRTEHSRAEICTLRVYTGKTQYRRYTIDLGFSAVYLTKKL